MKSHCLVCAHSAGRRTRHRPPRRGATLRVAKVRVHAQCAKVAGFETFGLLQNQFANHRHEGWVHSNRRGAVEVNAQAAAEAGGLGVEIKHDLEMVGEEADEPIVLKAPNVLVTVILC